MENKTFKRSYTTEELMVYRYRGYIVPVTLLLGIPGNALVLHGFIQLQRKMPCRFNLYVIWISISNILDMVFNTLLDDFIGKGLDWDSNFMVRYKGDRYSTFTCRLLSYLPEVFSFTAVWLLILFTIDRVFTIFDPIRYRGDLYLRITWIGIFVVFSAGFFLFSPQLIYRGLKYEYGEEENETCVLLDPRLPGVNYLLFVQVICTLVSPILIIFVLNILIIVKLRQAKQSQLLLRYGQPKLYQVSTKPATAPISLGLNCTETKVTSLGINGSTSGTTAIEMSRIMGNLGLTVIFLFLSIPLAVVVVVRQNSDSMGYSITYQAYHKRLVDLSRFFSSFKSLRYIIDFWIYLLFILRFRQTMIRLFSSQSKESCRRSKLMSKLCFCCFSSMPKRRTSLSTKRFSSIQDRETKYSQTQSQFSRFKQELQNKNSASIFRPLKKTNWTRSSIADKNQIISSETSKLVLPDSLERQQVANPNCLSENISSKQIVSGPSSCTRPVEPVVCNSHSSLSNPSSLCIRDWSSLEYVDQSDSLVENFGHSMKSDLRSQPKCLEEEVNLNIP